MTETKDKTENRPLSCSRNKTGNSPLSCLKAVYGHDHFRPGQRELIDAILDGRDVLGILPTGGGKSVCYQIPALLLPGVTIVISPLISLMHDQVEALRRRGIAAEIVTSEMTGQVQKQTLEEMQRCWPRDGERQGGPHLLYVSPERLQTAAFLDFSRRTDIRFVCVDEAHCISHWGAEFRPSYRKIREYLESLPVRPVVAAFTATATPFVRNEIIRYTGLMDPYCYAASFDRPALYYEVRHVKEKWPELKALLHNYRGMCGVVYCMTRRTVDRVARQLAAEGVAAARYHAGMPADERAENQEKWLRGKCPLIVATNAFGMGIDKPDVRFVIHYQMPGNVENYYQEAGRAGRDGGPADCILLYSDADVKVNHFFIRAVRSKELRAAMRAQLDAMRQYCGGKECLRGYLLRYFGESAGVRLPGGELPPASRGTPRPAARNCGRCSVCLGLTALPPRTPKDIEDHALYRSLIAVRLRVAKEKGKIQYRICSDAALHDMAARRPESMVDLISLEHTSIVSCLRYGREFLAEIRVWNRSH